MTKVQTTKTQIDKWDDMKLKSDCMAKEQQTERAAIEWAEILSGVLRKQKTHHKNANIGFSLLLMHLRL